MKEDMLYGEGRITGMIHGSKPKFNDLTYAKGEKEMMYVQKTDSKTAKARRAAFDELRGKVQQGLPATQTEDPKRIQTTPYLLPGEKEELERNGANICHAVVSEYARELYEVSRELFRIYNGRDAGPELVLSLYDFAEHYIVEQGNGNGILEAVLDEVERRVQIPQEEQATA